jgi:signal transduction histidine kinase
VRVRSAVGGGSVFEVWLPALHAADVAGSESPQHHEH